MISDDKDNENDTSNIESITKDFDQPTDQINSHNVDEGKQSPHIIHAIGNDNISDDINHSYFPVDPNFLSHDQDLDQILGKNEEGSLSNYGIEAFPNQEMNFDLINEEMNHNIINMENLSSLVKEVEDLNIANDKLNSLSLDSQDILDMGNHLIIEGGSTLNFIEFQDEGWTKLSNNDPLPEGTHVEEGYDTYVHDSGAIIQISTDLNTNYTDSF